MFESIKFMGYPFKVNTLLAHLDTFKNNIQATRRTFSLDYELRYQHLGTESMTGDYVSRFHTKKYIQTEEIRKVFNFAHQLF